MKNTHERIEKKSEDWVLPILIALLILTVANNAKYTIKEYYIPAIKALVQKK